MLTSEWASLEAFLAQHPGLDSSQLQQLKSLARLLARRHKPAQVLQQLQILLERLAPELDLLRLEGVETEWMSASNRQRFNRELLHLLALPAPEREVYLNQHESWRGPLGLFSETPQTLQDLAELGLQPPCSQSDIRQAFRQKAQLTHPDRGGDQKAFIRLQTAYLRALKHCL